MNRAARVAVAAVVCLAIVGVAAAWFLGLFSSEPEEASVEASLDALAEEDRRDSDDPPGADGEPAGSDGEPTDAADGGGDEAGSVGAGSGDTDATEVQPVADLTGTWTVEPSDATFVGYRIFEVLSGVDFEAVGRTGTVSGTLVADGTTVTSVDILADLRDLQSDNGARDAQMRTQALESDIFPDGIFSLTAPIELVTVPPAGETVTVTASGELTIHGVTQPVEFELSGAAQDGRLVVVGSIAVTRTQFEIETPQAPIVASVEDDAIIEFSLVFSRS